MTRIRSSASPILVERLVRVSLTLHRVADRHRSKCRPIAMDRVRVGTGFLPGVSRCDLHGEAALVVATVCSVIAASSALPWQHDEPSGWRTLCCTAHVGGRPIYQKPKFRLTHYPPEQSDERGRIAVRAAKRGFTRRPRRNEATEGTEKEFNVLRAKRIAVSQWFSVALASPWPPCETLLCRAAHQSGIVHPIARNYPRYALRSIVPDAIQGNSVKA